MTTGEIIALIKAFGGGSGGGGSSGSGALKVNVTVTESGDDTIYRLDKTWKQISDAIDNGTIPYAIDYKNGYVNTLSEIHTYEHDGAMVYSVYFGNDYKTDSENGYPTYEKQGGWN